MSSGPSQSSLDQWHSRFQPEPCLYPALPIVDCHHHFFPDASPKPRPPQFAASFGRVETTVGYMPANLKRDAAPVNLIATVHAEAGRFYLEPPVPQYLRPVGETAKMASICAETGGLFCRGIIAALNLTLPTDQIISAIIAHRMQLTPGCVLSGIRFSIAHDALNEMVSAQPKDVVRQPRVAENARVVGRMGLTIDVWIYHEQLEDLHFLASQAPNTTFVCDHVGMPIRGGSRAKDLDRVWEDWKRGMDKLATLDNVLIKLGGLAMFVGGFCKDEPLSSESFASDIRPWIEFVVARFLGRIMFESNFPMDKGGISYVNLWNTFFRLAKGWTREQICDAFYECANRAYQLGLPKRELGEFELGPLRSDL